MEIFADDIYRRNNEMDVTFANIANRYGIAKGIEYLQIMGAKTLDIDNYEIMYTINEFTKNKNECSQMEIFINNLLKNKNYINSVDIEMNKEFNLPELVIQTVKGEVRALQFSSLCEGIKQTIPYIETNERKGRCFNTAFYISLALGLNNEIVTGHIYGYTDISRFLHSWVEFNYQGKDYVVDGTLNAMINKEGYYLIRKAEPITFIPYLTLREDVLKYSSINKMLPLPDYYINRENVISDFDKEKQKVKKLN